MGVVCKVPMQRSELIQMMCDNIAWEHMSRVEAERMHKDIVKAANLVILAAPKALREVTVSSRGR